MLDGVFSVTCSKENAKPKTQSILLLDKLLVILKEKERMRQGMTYQLVRRVYLNRDAVSFEPVDHGTIFPLAVFLFSNLHC